MVVSYSIVMCSWMKERHMVDRPQDSQAAGGRWDAICQWYATSYLWYGSCKGLLGAVADRPPFATLGPLGS